MRNPSYQTDSSWQHVFWLPSSFEVPVGIPWNTADKCGYLMHSVYRGQTLHGGDPVTLNARIMRRVVGQDHYYPLMTALFEGKYIVKTSPYIMGQRSGRYAIGERFENDHRFFYTVKNKRLIRSMAHERERFRLEQSRRRLPVHDYWESALRDHFTIDREIALENLARRFCLQESDPGNGQICLVEDLADGKFRYVVDRFGRAHSSVTNLSKCTRIAWRIQNESVFCIDGKNAQMVCLGMLLSGKAVDVVLRARLSTEQEASHPDHKAGEKERDRETHHMWKVFGKLGGKIGKIIDVEFAKCDDVKRFCELASDGRTYEYLGAKTGWDRPSTKLGALKYVLGAKARYPGNALQDVFVREFPNVWRFIRLVNSKSNATLFRVLQRIESTLFVVVVGEILQKQGIIALTIHDSIVCRERDIHAVQKAILAASEGQLALNQPENWGPRK